MPEQTLDGLLEDLNQQLFGKLIKSVHPSLNGSGEMAVVITLEDKTEFILTPTIFQEKPRIHMKYTPLVINGLMMEK